MKWLSKSKLFFFNFQPQKRLIVTKLIIKHPRTLICHFFSLLLPYILWTLLSLLVSSRYSFLLPATAPFSSSLCLCSFPGSISRLFCHLIETLFQMVPILLLLHSYSFSFPLWQRVPQKGRKIKLNKCKPTYRVIYSFVQKNDKTLKSDNQTPFRTWQYWETETTSTNA